MLGSAAVYYRHRSLNAAKALSIPICNVGIGAVFASNRLAWPKYPHFEYSDPQTLNSKFASKAGKHALCVILRL